jgi:crotonobetainyl-CoA:carnitine CoA-transferase CaiB-like acyl-CoA transferase
LQTNEERVEARPKLVPIVANVIRSQSIAEMMRQLEQLKIPYAPVARPGDLFDDPHLNHAGRMHRTYISDGRYANLPGIPVEIGGQHMPLRMQPPAAGEHSAEILREIGITDPEIARLKKQGVVRTKDGG